VTSPADDKLHTIIRQQPFPLLFATISGAHLYGFPSPDSDYDVRGVHILPVREIAQLDPGEETLEESRIINGTEIDLVTHDIKKFLLMMLKRNGYVLEQLHSPLVLLTTPEHAELIEIARGCVTRHHAHHYLGFAQTQWDLFYKENSRRVKPLLYVYRVLLTGIHLMQTGEIEANLLTLNSHFKLSHVDDLIAQKRQGTEKGALEESNITFHQREVERLTKVLEDARGNSALPEAPTCKEALNDLVLRVRLKTL
jgi:uncharacterized protein